MWYYATEETLTVDEIEKRFKKELKKEASNREWLPLWKIHDIGYYIYASFLENGCVALYNDMIHNIFEQKGDKWYFR